LIYIFYPLSSMSQTLTLGKRFSWTDETNAAIRVDLEANDAQAVRIHENSAQSAYSFEIENNALDSKFGLLMLATTTTTMLVTSAITTGVALDLGLAALTTGKGLDMSDMDAVTTGKAIHVDATGVTQTDGILVHVDSASTALTSTGRLLLVDHTGNAGVSAVVAEVKSAAADETTVLKVTATAALAAGVGLDVSVAALTTGTALRITGAVATTTGSLVSVNDNSADTGTRSVVSIVQDHASATGATALFVQADNPTIAAVKITGAATIGIDFTGLGATDFLWDCTAASGCTAAPQTNAAIGFVTIKVAGTQQWIPYYNAT
jgi:hypothetical protein